MKRKRYIKIRLNNISFKGTGMSEGCEAKKCQKFLFFPCCSLHQSQKFNNSKLRNVVGLCPPLSPVVGLCPRERPMKVPFMGRFCLLSGQFSYANVRFI